MTDGWSVQSRTLPIGRLFFFGAVGGLIVGAVLSTVAFLIESAAPVAHDALIPDEFLVGTFAMVGGFAGVVIGVLGAGAACVAFVLARRKLSRGPTYAVASVAAALVGGLCGAFLVRSQPPTVGTVAIVATIAVATGVGILVSLWAIGRSASRA